MHRAQPQASKLLERRWADIQHERHELRLKQIKPTHQIKQPQQFNHLVTKPKRIQMLEERYTEIEKENRILLEKMTNILSSKQQNVSQVPYSNVVAQNTASSQQNQHNNKQISTTSSLPPIKRSLNHGARKRELFKITQENQLILKRLQARKPCYDVKQWEKEDLGRQKMVEQICEYPYQLRERNQSVGFAQNSKTISQGYQTHQFQTIQQQDGESIGQIVRKKNNTADASDQDKPIRQRGKKFQVQKQIMYQGEHDLGVQSVFAIQILIGIENDMTIMASNSDGPESFVIEIGPERITKLMEVFQGDFHHLANHLKLMNERMVLVNPNFQGLTPPSKVSAAPDQLNEQKQQDQNQNKSQEEETKESIKVDDEETVV